MAPLITEIATAATPESLARQFQCEPGLMLLRSALLRSADARYSLVTARPFLNFRSWASRCEIWSEGGVQVQWGNPWSVLQSLMARYEMPEETGLPFPLGGCFGFWGYDLKNFVEPKLARRAENDLPLPDCQTGFYDSLVVFDHFESKTWIISTGILADGSRSAEAARRQTDFWAAQLAAAASGPASDPEFLADRTVSSRLPEGGGKAREGMMAANAPALDTGWRSPALPAALAECGAAWEVRSNLAREDYIARVKRAQAYIRAGDIYQVNLSQRLELGRAPSAWELYQRLVAASPAPFAACCNFGDFEIVSSSPELFLRLSGAEVITRPIKGTRPRSADPVRDEQLRVELESSAKERAELVMITDLLRNDLGRFCEFGSVGVPDLARLETFPQVQHLVSTIRGRLRPEVSHAAALASAFPGGSITGAPKFRAMEIIDELEPVTRGPYTGALGYLGFNRQSQLSILIRTAICRQDTAWFHVGAGIVADSCPEAEYEETLAKAAGFFAAQNLPESRRRPGTGSGSACCF